MSLVTDRALKFDQQVLIIGMAYGLPGFWCEVLTTDSHSLCALSCDTYDQYHRVG